MKLNLDTDTALARVRHHFGVDGMTLVDVIYHRRSGHLASVEINGVVTKKGMPYFADLDCLVRDAEYEQEIRAKKLLERSDRYKTINELADKYSYKVSEEC